MSTIYRGRSTGGTWLYGFFTVFEQYPKIWVDSTPFDVDIDTVGQGTGIKDVKGNEIFEKMRCLGTFPADVFPLPVIGTILYENGAFIFRAEIAPEAWVNLSDLVQVEIILD